MDSSQPGSSVHGIFQARILEWVPFPSPEDLPDPGKIDCVDHNKTLENSERDGNTRPPVLPLEKSVCRSRSTVRTGHGTTDWFQIRKRLRQGCILSPCLFNLYAEYITRNARLGEAQAGIKIARKNFNNLRYADNTTFLP